MNVLGISIIMGLYYWFVCLRFGYTFSGILFQPLGAALVVGSATGKLSEVTVVEAGIRLVYLRVISASGGNMPSDPALTSATAIPIILGVGMNAETAVALAISFDVLSVFMDRLRQTISAT